MHEWIVLCIIFYKHYLSEAFSEFCQISKIERFCENSKWFIFINHFWKTLPLRCLTEFWIHLWLLLIIRFRRKPVIFVWQPICFLLVKLYLCNSEIRKRKKYDIWTTVWMVSLSDALEMSSRQRASWNEYVTTRTWQLQPCESN